uniref:DUF4290 domain-containing protein n=1 Tax=Haemonchus contortus TaxID=6289 RepID=A0A7I4Z4T2_HAECO
ESLPRFSQIMDNKKFPGFNPCRAGTVRAPEDDELFKRYLEGTKRWHQHIYEFNCEELAIRRKQINEFAVLVDRFVKTVRGEGREPIERPAIKAAVERYQREQQQHVSNSRANDEALLAEARKIRSTFRDGKSNNDSGNPHGNGSLRQRMKIYKEKLEGVLELIKDETAPADPEPNAASANTTPASRGSGKLVKRNNPDKGSPALI